MCTARKWLSKYNAPNWKVSQLDEIISNCLAELHWIDGLHHCRGTHHPYFTFTFEVLQEGVLGMLMMSTKNPHPFRMVMTRI